MTTASDDSARTDEVDEGARAPAWRRIVGGPVAWARVLLFPFEAVPQVVAAGRFGGVLAVITLCAAAAVATSATRLDMAPGELRKEVAAAAAQPPQQGAAAPQMGKSDREFDEAVEKAYAVEVVKMSGGALLVPLRLLVLGLLLFLVGRFVGGKPRIRAVMALAAHAGLPGAVKSALAAAAALRQTRLTPEAVTTLVPLPWGALEGAPLQRLLGGLNPFALWTVLLLGVGLPHAAGIGRGKAWATLGVCYVLFLLVSL